MAAKKPQKQGQANAQPKQALVALKPFKKVPNLTEKPLEQPFHAKWQNFLRIVAIPLIF